MTCIALGGAILKHFSITFAELRSIPDRSCFQIQGDRAAFAKPPVDFETKFRIGLACPSPARPKWNLCFEVNKRFCTSCSVTLYIAFSLFFRDRFGWWMSSDTVLNCLYLRMNMGTGPRSWQAERPEPRSLKEGLLGPQIIIPWQAVRDSMIYSDDCTQYVCLGREEPEMGKITCKMILDQRSRS